MFIFQIRLQLLFMYNCTVHLAYNTKSKLKSYFFAVYLILNLFANISSEQFLKYERGLNLETTFPDSELLFSPGAPLSQDCRHAPWEQKTLAALVASSSID